MPSLDNVWMRAHFERLGQLFKGLQKQPACSACGTHRRRLKRCGGCLAGLYCGTQCQKEHWKASHRHLCQVDRLGRQSWLSTGLPQPYAHISSYLTWTSNEYEGHIPGFQPMLIDFEAGVGHLRLIFTVINNYTNLATLKSFDLFKSSPWQGVRHLPQFAGVVGKLHAITRAHSIFLAPCALRYERDDGNGEVYAILPMRLAEQGTANLSSLTSLSAMSCHFMSNPGGEVTPVGMIDDAFTILSIN